MLAFLWAKYNFFRFWSEIWPRNVLDRFVTFKPEQRSQRYNNIAWHATWNIQHNIQRDTVNTSRYTIQPDTRLHKYTTQYDSMHMKRAEDFHTLREQLRDGPWQLSDRAAPPTVYRWNKVITQLQVKSWGLGSLGRSTAWSCVLLGRKEFLLSAAEISSETLQFARCDMCDLWVNLTKTHFLKQKERKKAYWNQ